MPFADQQKYFSSVSAVPTILIRHGVCLNFFTPLGVGHEDVPRLLFVGQWMRDFETLLASMEIIWRKNPRVELDCVVPRQARNNSAVMQLARNAAVRWHADIDANDLRSLYRKATILFLPLIDGSANNAIVEALSCGLPVISTNHPSVEEYVPDACGQLAEPGAADNMRRR